MQLVFSACPNLEIVCLRARGCAFAEFHLSQTNSLCLHYTAIQTNEETASLGSSLCCDDVKLSSHCLNSIQRTKKPTSLAIVIIAVFISGI